MYVLCEIYALTSPLCQVIHKVDSPYKLMYLIQAIFLEKIGKYLL